ncbi:DUF805 domain-containing protein [Neisseria yangbaofengii]|uniref:DUF805 domain-containing protein n=1 Tax=Neisseria yangbaofengii TaxID=2709396 RepID=UPI0013EA79A0|nr:DUF805 domain-containing protein [Neisseria yangbaofengii]
MKKFRTHYDNLNVSQNASPEVIKAAYKALAHKHHPDRNTNKQEAERIMKIINEAYRILSNEKLRAEHDRWIAEQEQKFNASSDTSSSYHTDTPQPEPHFEQQQGSTGGTGFSQSQPDNGFNQEMPLDKTMWQYFIAAITKNYFNFSGRATRKEMWAVFLYPQLLIACPFLVAASIGLSLPSNTEIEIGTIFVNLFLGSFGLLAGLVALLAIPLSLYAIIPAISTRVRRLHDLGFSGWWLLLIFLLYLLIIGFIIDIILMFFIEGNRIDNRYGPSPYPIKPNYSVSDILVIIATPIIACLFLLAKVSLPVQKTVSNPPEQSTYSTQSNTFTQPATYQEPVQSAPEQPVYPAQTQYTPQPTQQPTYIPEPATPVGMTLTLTQDVHIRQCPSKQCSSIGVLPKDASVTVSTDESNTSSYNGWLFVNYYGYFCQLQNHSNKTGCVSWDEDIEAKGWVYSGNLR